MAPSFGRPRQLLRGEVDRFRGLTVHMRDVFLVSSHCGYECGCCKVIVIRIYSSSHNIYVFGVYRNVDAYGRWSPWIEMRLFCWLAT